MYSFKPHLVLHLVCVHLDPACCNPSPADSWVQTAWFWGRPLGQPASQLKAIFSSVLTSKQSIQPSKAPPSLCLSARGFTSGWLLFWPCMISFFFCPSLPFISSLKAAVVYFVHLLMAQQHKDVNKTHWIGNIRLDIFKWMTAVMLFIFSKRCTCSS